ncbi:MAG: endopeptidase La, partial [Christensenellaceae bacterium]|nr:endopeptidase La [Christensenellaceae bacterium]
IEVSGYTGYEKTQIAKRHLIPKLLEEHGLTRDALRFEQSAIEAIIEQYTAESGVRTLERTLAKVMRRAAKEFVEGKQRAVVRKSTIKKYLGAPRFVDTKLPQEPSVGTVVGLAWTAYGGVTMPIEVSVMQGGGNLELTGQLGDVMKESAKTGISLIRSCAEDLGIPADFHEKSDIHIHIPEGAVPKDGPSAGITMALAVVSALTGRKVRHDIAMTGEITLTGRVLPIGGLKEKTLAAVRGGIYEVIIPKINEKDIEEIPEEIQKKVTFRPVENFGEVMERALYAD